MEPTSKASTPQQSPEVSEQVEALRAELGRVRGIVERKPGWDGLNYDAPATELVGIALVVMENAEQFERVVCDEGVKEGGAVLVDDGAHVQRCCGQAPGQRQFRGLLVRFCRGHAVVNLENERGGGYGRTINAAYCFIHKAPEGEGS